MTKHNFEAETGKILELLTHSIYSNKEIFLRELISNASDAIDKARLKALTDTTFLGDDHNFEIKIKVDKENNIIEIEDNGIGMTGEEVMSNIGTIAKSGTKEFLEKLKKAKETEDHNLIGQFGVGFYSSFMVADKVELETKSPLDKASHKWISDGKSEYEISEAKKENRGTIIRLFIDEANKELIEEWKIKELIKKYSNYAPVPILLEEEEKDDKGNVTGKSFKQVNETVAIWKKSKTSVKKEEYNEFYKAVSMDFNEPLGYIHSSVEGAVSYKSLLFIPKEKNMFANMDDPNKDYGPKLYVQNVLILENAKELLPVWLRFVSGVVETSDLPLNISREMLQSNGVLEKIKASLIKKVLVELKKIMKNDPESYDKFLQNFRMMLKEGVYYEGNKDDIAELIKFKSMLENKDISLDEYLEKAEDDKKEDCCSDKEGEKKEGGCCGGSCHEEKEPKSKKTIYYITGKTEGEVLSSPYLSQFKENKVDVLLFTDSIDEWLIQSMSEYKGNRLKSVTSSDIKLKEETEEEKDKKEKRKKEFKDMLELTKNTIGAEKIEKVELNENLGDALAALTTPENGLNPQMEKMMKSMGQAIPPQKRILELNPNNKLVKSMKKEFSSDVKSKKLNDLINYSYSQAILLEGGEIENIGEFVRLTNKFAGEYIK